jgi:hypothetical protein
LEVEEAPVEPRVVHHHDRIAHKVEEPAGHAVEGRRLHQIVETDPVHPLGAGVHGAAGPDALHPVGGEARQCEADGAYLHHPVGVPLR